MRSTQRSGESKGVAIMSVHMRVKDPGIIIYRVVVLRYVIFVQIVDANDIIVGPDLNDIIKTNNPGQGASTASIRYWVLARPFFILLQI